MNCTCHMYLWIVVGPSLLYLGLLNMFLITGDRLLASILSIRYKVISTPRRAIAVVIGLWCVVLLVYFPITSVMFFHHGQDWYKRNVSGNLTYVWLSMNVLFFLFAVSAYVKIFLIFVQSRRAATSSEHSIFHLFTSTMITW